MRATQPWLAGWALAAGLAAALANAQSQPAVMRIKAPELRGIEAWINTGPLTLKKLRGQVVVLHFWTFG